MKRIIFLIILIASLSSCKSYFMSTVYSPDIQSNESTGIFSLENDSLIIKYSFSGESSPLNVVIYNKLNEPVYINWKNSALIVADKSYSFSNDDLKTGERPFPNVINSNTTRNIQTDRNAPANVQLSNSQGFIPPKAKISRFLYAFNNIRLNKIQDSAFKRIALNYTHGMNDSTYVKEAFFSEETSPLKFKTYLTLFTLKDNQPAYFSYHHGFFISNVAKSSTNPKKLLQYTKNPGNVIMDSKITGYGKTITGIALISTMGGLAAADAVLIDKK